MPIYEFECPRCKTIFEEQKHINEEIKAICKNCGIEAKSIISLSSFKVNGFSALNGYSRANK